MAMDEPDISSSAPTEDEVKSALKKLSNGKAPGCWNIAPEMLTAGGPAMVAWLTALFQSCWPNNTVPEGWKTGIIYNSTNEIEAGETATTFVASHCFLTWGNVLLIYRLLLEMIKGRLIATRRKEQSGSSFYH